ncbi:MAG: DUF2064 domain-containing protein [Pricia sp.]
MGQKNTDTAVLIFSLSARREAERKSLFDKKKSDGKFFDVLIGRTRKLAAKSGVDAFFIDERQQQGHTFGQRYANAFQQIFDQGYTKVVSIGNDSPDLTADTLRKAIDEIQYNDLVVGPSADGGVYLLGMSASLFDKQEFLNLPWLQECLYDTLNGSDYWKQGGSFSLDVLVDIDDRASLLEFIEVTSDGLLIDIILFHLSYLADTFAHPKDIQFKDADIATLTLRGPPSFRKAA